MENGLSKNNKGLFACSRLAILFLLFVTIAILLFGYHGTMLCLLLIDTAGEGCMILFISTPALIIGISLFVVSIKVKSKIFNLVDFLIYALIFAILLSIMFIYNTLLNHTLEINTNNIFWTILPVLFISLTLIIAVIVSHNKNKPQGEVLPKDTLK